EQGDERVGREVEQAFRGILAEALESVADDADGDDQHVERADCEERQRPVRQPAQPVRNLARGGGALVGAGVGGGGRGAVDKLVAGGAVILCGAWVVGQFRLDSLPWGVVRRGVRLVGGGGGRSEEHTS